MYYEIHPITGTDRTINYIPEFLEAAKTTNKYHLS